MNISKLVRFNLKVNKSQIIGWCVALFLTMFLYMILFPSVKDMAQIKMDAMPKELLQFVGMENFSDMGNFVDYFAIIYKLILVAISIFATIFASGLIEKEEKNKTIEFLYGLNISRSEIYLSKLITSYIAVMLVLIFTCSAAIICGYINGGETFDLIKIITIIKTSSLTPFIFMSIGLLISASSPKLSGSTLGSMIFLLSYILGYLSTLLKDYMEWLKYFSPLDVFSPTLSLQLNTDTVLNMFIYCLIMIVCIVVGHIIYKRRDFNVS